jgi:hypothetical protein
MIQAADPRRIRRHSQMITQKHQTRILHARGGGGRVDAMSPTRTCVTMDEIGSPLEGGSEGHAAPDLPTHLRTRLQNNILKPKKFGGNFVCLVTTTGEPRYFDDPSTQEEWWKAMDVKYQALEKNKSWHLVTRNEAKNVIDSNWVYKIKGNADGSIDRYKAHFVAKRL